MLEVQKYLRSKYNALEAITEEFSIKAKRHGKHPNLVCLKYSQLESPFAEQVVRECRGIILDEANDWAVVSYPYNKFFNHGEQLAAEIDWTTATFEPKLDGSLMTLYSYDGRWLVQSSGTADGNGEVGDFGFSFADLFWQVWEEKGYSTKELDVNLCYMFELETPYNRVVVKQEENCLTLHGVRNIKTLKEECPHSEGWINEFDILPSIPVDNLDYLLHEAKTLDPMVQEGFIVRDSQFNRIKIKTEQYVRLSHFREGMTRNKLLAIAINNEGSEFVSYFKEYAEVYTDLAEKYDRLVAKVQKIWTSTSRYTNQKDFALRVKDYPFSGALFQLKAGKVSSVREYFQKVNVKSVMEYIKHYYG